MQSPPVTYSIIYTFFAYNFLQVQFQVHVKQAIVTAEKSLYETDLTRKKEDKNVSFVCVELYIIV